METFNITKGNNFFTGMDSELEIATEQDFTGYALEWTLWRIPLKRTASALVTKTTDDGITIDSDSQITVTVDAADTEGFPGSTVPLYLHFVIRTDTGSRQPLSSGTVVLQQGPPT